MGGAVAEPMGREHRRVFWQRGWLGWHFFSPQNPILSIFTFS
ncbi:MAG TPA: hypothetical protein VK957_01170 [Lunatimonas sp.]|nr:hypothetical protein [Lunatimonas sp.]